MLFNTDRTVPQAVSNRKILSEKSPLQSDLLQFLPALVCLHTEGFEETWTFHIKTFCFVIGLSASQVNLSAYIYSSYISSRGLPQYICTFMYEIHITITEKSSSRKKQGGRSELIPLRLRLEIPNWIWYAEGLQGVCKVYVQKECGIIRDLVEHF